MADDRITHIYVLRDPRDGEIRYVGKTVKSLAGRLYNHLHNAIHPASLGKRERDRNRGKTYRDKWIRSVVASGAKPIIESVESVVGGDWAEAEKRWISYYRSVGAKLTNATIGGEGAVGFRRSDRERELISIRTKAAWLDPEWAEKTRAAIKEANADPELRMGRSRILDERWSDPRERELIISARTAAWTPEARKKQADRFQGIQVAHVPLEAIERRAASLRRTLQSDEKKKENSDRSKNMWSDPEFRAKRMAQIEAKKSEPGYAEMVSRRSEASRVAMQSPEARERLKAGQMAGWVKRKSKNEPSTTSVIANI